MIDYSRAKEIFFTYSSSKFQMMRDGFSAEYSSCHVPEELESQWLIELIKQELNKLDINNPENLFPLWYILETNCKSEYLTDIIDFAENNINKAESELNLLRFTQKISETIDRLQSSCSKSNPFELERFRRRIKIIRNEPV